MKSYLFLILLVISLVVSGQNTYNNDYFDCLSYHVLDHSIDFNCHQLALKFNISVLTLEAINPGLNCSDLLKNVYLVCSSAQNPKCLSAYDVLKNDSIASILKKFNLQKKDFFEANPFLNSINQSKIVCIKRMEPSLVMNIKRDTINTSIIQDNIKKRHEEIKYNINRNCSNDISENSGRFLKSRNYNQEILSIIKKNRRISEIIQQENLIKEKDEKKLNLDIEDYESISLTYTEYFLGIFFSFFRRNNYYSKKYFVFIECKSKILRMIELENSVINLMNVEDPN